MGAHRLLIADAEPGTWAEFRRSLGESWIVVGAASQAVALTEAEKQPFDVVVANSSLPDGDGADLLNHLRAANPKACRFIAADPSLKEKVMSHVLGGDQFLPLPFDYANLKNALDRSRADDYGMSSNVRELVGRIRTFPTIPSLYLEVVNALQDPNATTAEIGAIIAKDMSMTTKLVQVINSAYFGLSRNITDPTEAVGILGFETVKSLIVAVKLLSQYDKVKPVYFSIDSIWKHSTNVARTARVMALLETNDTNCSSLAYTGGLMHDLGKVILAANFDDQYHGAHNLARKQQIPLWEVEKDIFGATHGEIGAYLLAMWGLPKEVVKIAALHHTPHRAEDTEFTPLTAVHVANALEYEGNSENDGLPAPQLDAAYLQQLGMADRIEMWRFARREPDAAKFDTKLQRKKTAAKAPEKPATPAPAPAAVPVVIPAFAPAASETSVAREVNYFKFGIWLGLGLGATAALIFALCFSPKKPAPIAAAPSAPAKLAEVIAPTPVSSVAAPKPPMPVKPPQAGMVSSAALSKPPIAEKPALDRVKLEAIFFSSRNPTALLNGKIAQLNEDVAECRVIEISPTSVTLEHAHQRKVLTLR